MPDFVLPAKNNASPFADMRGHHVAVRTPSLAEAKDFYVGKLDFRERIMTRGSERAAFWRADRRQRLGAWVRSFAGRGLHWSQTMSPPASVFH